MKVALHVCCGPCVLEPYDALATDHHVLIVYANPNIQPAEEYERRREVVLGHAEHRGIAVVEIPYDPRLWEAATAAARSTREERCRACYDLRLQLTADAAVDAGCDALATTLSVSPYQDAVALEEIGSRIAAAHGLTWLGHDWRSRYPEATRRSRELGMYRQNYCGCLPSREEAERSRAECRDARRARKDR